MLEELDAETIGFPHRMFDLADDDTAACDPGRRGAVPAPRRVTS
jgi:hypothetical protein